MKKLISLLCLLSLMTNSTVYAEEFVAKVSEKNIINEDSQVQIPIIHSKIKKELKSAISKVYGSERGDEILANVERIALKNIELRPESLKIEDLTRVSDWYKDEIIYMFYVDQFGVVTPEKPNTFSDTAKMLDYLADLGVTTLYMLPFADSPMGDSGFDVKNPKDVRKDLGGMPEFVDFVKQAKSKGFKIKADLVLNHFSDEHPWFKAVQNGDLSKLNYFIAREKLPEFNKYVDKKLGTVVEYKENDGTISKRRLIFPDITENHYRKVTINEKDYYLYHTFYPFQLDINWENPEVLYYCLDTISYWANLGVDIFRMDAIPYLIKENGTNAENLSKTHQVIKILSLYLQATAPRTVIQAEACQMPKDILPYFGNERKIKTFVNSEERELKRTDEVQIAYHFPYMPALWATLIAGDNKYIQDANKQTPQIPSASSWAIFLRVHDELTLEMSSPEVRQIIYDSLVKKGAEFRKGFGVSGRMANFLDNNPARIEQAFSILLSMPGIPVIYYGDEIGIRNNYDYAKKYAKIRKENSKKQKIKLLSYFDSRDINRGDVAAKLFYGSAKDYYEFNSKIYKKVKSLIEIRKSLPQMSRGEFKILKTKSSGNFSYLRSYNGEQILVVNNLTPHKLVAEIDLPINCAIKSKEGQLVLNNLMTGQDIKVMLSLQNRKLTLLMRPYGSVWLKLPNNTDSDIE